TLAGFHYPQVRGPASREDTRARRSRPYAGYGLSSGHPAYRANSAAAPADTVLLSHHGAVGGRAGERLHAGAGADRAGLSPKACGERVARSLRGAPVRETGCAAAVAVRGKRADPDLHAHETRRPQAGPGTRARWLLGRHDSWRSHAVPAQRRLERISGRPLPSAGCDRYRIAWLALR